MKLRALFLILFSVVACRSANERPPVEPPPETSESFGAKVTADLLTFPDLPEIGRGIRLGALSGLVYEGKDEATGELKFLSHTDRGPNKESVNQGDVVLRPFVLPDFQPRWFRFTLNLQTRALTFKEQIPLVRKDNRPFTGLPNLGSGKWPDEQPVDVSGKKLPYDPMGIDPESIALDSDGTYWMGEEYRPSILHFSAGGQLLSRWIPENAPKSMGEGLLPKRFGRRQLNRGFEGLAVSGAHIYAILQTGLAKERGITRILKLEKSGRSVGEFIYRFEEASEGVKKIDKIGDITAIDGGKFLVIEQNGSFGSKAFRRVYEIDLSRATNVVNQKGNTLDQEELALIRPVEKRFVADLAELGFRDVEKAEGLARIDANTIAVVNDNDFGVAGDANSKSQMLLIRLP